MENSYVANYNPLLQRKMPHPSAPKQRLPVLNGAYWNQWKMPFVCLEALWPAERTQGTTCLKPLLANRESEDPESCNWIWTFPYRKPWFQKLLSSRETGGVLFCFVLDGKFLEFWYFLQILFVFKFKTHNVLGTPDISMCFIKTDSIIYYITSK